MVPVLNLGFKVCTGIHIACQVNLSRSEARLDPEHLRSDMVNWPQDGLIYNHSRLLPGSGRVAHGRNPAFAAKGLARNLGKAWKPRQAGQMPTLQLATTLAESRQ